MTAFYAETGASGPAPSVVAETVLDIVSGKITAFRTLSGPDGASFVAMRGSMTDEAWIAISDTLDDAVFFERFGAAVAGR